MLNDNTSILDLVDEVAYSTERMFQSMERVNASALGLDPRCGTVRICRDERVIMVESSRSIDYYGGFEYIETGGGRVALGDYTVYVDCERVEDCFDHMEEAEEDKAQAVEADE